MFTNEMETKTEKLIFNVNDADKIKQMILGLFFRKKFCIIRAVRKASFFPEIETGVHMVQRKERVVTLDGSCIKISTGSHGQFFYVYGTFFEFGPDYMIVSKSAASSEPEFYFTFIIQK